MKAAVLMTLAAAVTTAAPLLQAHPVRFVRVRPAAAVIVRGPVLRIHAGGVVHVRSGHGRLDVEVSPERAKVFVDGHFEGHGDQHLTLHAGAHRVKVVLGDGREIESEVVHVEAGHLTRVHLDL